MATKWTRRGFECGILFGIAMRSLKIVKCVRVALHSSIETVHVNQSNQSIFRVEENNNREKSSAKSVYCFTSLGCEVATGYCCCFESDNNFLALIVTFFRYLRWHGYLFLLIVIFERWSSRNVQGGRGFSCKWYLCGWFYHCTPSPHRLSPSVSNNIPSALAREVTTIPRHNTFISHAKVHDIISFAWNQTTRVHFLQQFFSPIPWLSLSFSLSPSLPSLIPFVLIFISFLIVSHCYFAFDIIHPNPFFPLLHRTYFDMSLAYYFFSFSKPFTCTHFYFTFLEKHSNDFHAITILRFTEEEKKLE